MKTRLDVLVTNLGLAPSREKAKAYIMSGIVYVNGQFRNTDTPIGKLMHDFFCVDADEILNPLLKDRVKYL